MLVHSLTTNLSPTKCSQLEALVEGCDNASNISTGFHGHRMGHGGAGEEQRQFKHLKHKEQISQGV